MQSAKIQNERENCIQQSRTLETLEKKYAAQVEKSKEIESKANGFEDQLKLNNSEAKRHEKRMSEDFKKVIAQMDDLKNKLSNAEQRLSEYRQKEVAFSESQQGREKEFDRLKHELEKTKRELDDTKQKYGDTIFVFVFTKLQFANCIKFKCFYIHIICFIINDSVCIQ